LTNCCFAFCQSQSTSLQYNLQKITSFWIPRTPYRSVYLYL